MHYHYRVETCIYSLVKGAPGTVTQNHIFSGSDLMQCRTDAIQYYNRQNIDLHNNGFADVGIIIPASLWDNTACYTVALYVEGSGQSFDLSGYWVKDSAINAQAQELATLLHAGYSPDSIPPLLVLSITGVRQLLPVTQYTRAELYLAARLVGWRSGKYLINDSMRAVPYSRLPWLARLINYRRLCACLPMVNSKTAAHMRALANREASTLKLRTNRARNCRGSAQNDIYCLAA